MDPVPSGPSAEEDHDLPGFGRVVLQKILAFHDPQTADVDEAVARVLVVEEESSGYRRDADPVAVIPYTGYDALHQILRVLDTLGDLHIAVYGTETEGVNQTHGLGAHAYDVPHDPSDTGRGPSVGLDGRRMVVALHPEGVAVVVIEHHHAGIASGKDVVAVQSEHELLQGGFGALIAAMLAPRLPEGLELHVGGLPPLFHIILLYGLHLVERETEGHGGGYLLQFLVGSVPDDYVAQVVGGVPLHHTLGHRIISR